MAQRKRDRSEKPRIKKKTKFKSEIIGYALELVIAVTMLAVFVPLQPELPAVGNDPSWRFAINQAVAQKLVFGRDLVYTYGPYASVFTRAYHPATDRLMLGGSFFLGLCYALLLVMLARITQRRWMLLMYAGFCAGLMYSHEVIRDAPRDALLYSYPLLLALLTHRITSDAVSERVSASRFKIAFCILFLPYGLLPLIKASFLLVCGSLGLCSLVLLLRNKQTKIAALCVFPPLIFGVLLWIVSGQPILGLPSFFINMRPIIAGYTEAMSLAGNSGEILLYLLASAAVLYAACIDKGGSIFQKAAAAVSYALFLFFAFKEGFVRHDAHAMVAGTAVVLAVLSSILALRTKPLVLAANALFAVVVCGYIDSHYVKFSLGRIVTNTLDSYRDAFDGLASRLSGGSGFESQFRESLASIKKEASMPALQGTTDIYSFNQSVLFANGQTWSPRPVFQSYAAFTTDLMRLNADHLLGANAPQNIVFRVEPIDDRLPALEDGLSWPVLIQNYAISGADNFFLYLKKRVTPAADHALPEIYSGRHTLESDVPLPVTKDALIAEIDVQPTLLGKLWTALYKPPELRISVTLTGGQARNFRFVPGMAKAGFILSPLITDTNEFVLLTAASRDNLARNVVKSFSISAVAGKSLFWQDTYSVRLAEFK